MWGTLKENLFKNSIQSLFSKETIHYYLKVYPEFDWTVKLWCILFKLFASVLVKKKKSALILMNLKWFKNINVQNTALQILINF